MKPLHRAKVELSYTLTLRDKAEKKAAEKLAELDRRVIEKQERLNMLERAGVTE